MRALVLGAGGQLGTELVAEMRRRGHSVVGLGRQELDITGQAAIEQALEKHSPGWVVNSAAYNQVDLAEKEPLLALKINGLAVRTIAIACRKAGATLMHFSTDHVFDGEKGTPYTEDDQPNPPSSYGISKRAGELYALAYIKELFLVRVAGVFGPAGRHTNRGNFPELVLKKAAEKSPLNVVDDFFASPTYAPALATRCIDLLEKAPFGLYHIGGGLTISWYDYALKILEVANLKAPISPTNHREFRTLARRPRRSPLSNAKMEGLGLAPMPPLEDALREYMELRKHVRPHGMK